MLFDRNGWTIHLGDAVSIQMSDGKIIEGNVIDIHEIKNLPGSVTIEDHEDKRLYTFFPNEIDIITPGKDSIQDAAKRGFNS